MNTDDPSPQPRRRGRPPKQDDSVAATKEKMIRAGVETLTEKGFTAVGIDEILTQVGVPKGSFYYYFSGKEEFISSVVSSYADYMARKLDRCFLNETRAPLDRLSDFIEDAGAGMARYDFRRGCPIGNLGQEMGALPEGFRDRLHAVFLDWQARTARCLAAARAAGQIAADADCDDLAAFFWIGWEGAVLRAKLERSPAPLDAFARGFFAAVRR